LLHQTIQEAKDAEDYLRHCEALGYESLSDEEMARLRADRQQLIERFGKPFKNQYGWASELFDQNENPNFRELEELAGHGTHASSLRMGEPQGACWSEGSGIKCAPPGTILSDAGGPDQLGIG
jgi:hypothetical protein